MWSVFVLALLEVLVLSNALISSLKVVKIIFFSYLCFLLSDPISADLDKYDVVSLSDALRDFLQDLQTPIIPPIVYNELVYTAQGTQTYSRLTADLLNVSLKKKLRCTFGRNLVKM